MVIRTCSMAGFQSPHVSVGAQVLCSSSGMRMPYVQQTLQHARVLLRCVARQRDTRDHLLTEGQQPQRIFGRNHGWEAGGDRIEILDRFREEPRPHGQRKEVSVSYEETPAPIDATDLLGQRLWHETPHPIRQWIGRGMFRPAYTHAVDILTAWLQQPGPKSC